MPQQLVNLIHHPCTHNDSSSRNSELNGCLTLSCIVQSELKLSGLHALNRTSVLLWVCSRNIAVHQSSKGWKRKAL